MLRMVAASPADLDALEQMLEEARSWLARVGVPQWQVPFDRQELTYAIDNHRVILALDEGMAPIGSLHLSFEHDPAWEPHPGDAGYIHRLVVAQRATGRGVGAAMLDWAQGRAAEGGAPALRLYCVEENERLVRYYSQLGFVHVGTSMVPRQYDGADVPVALLERRTELH